MDVLKSNIFEIENSISNSMDIDSLVNEPANRVKTDMRQKMRRQMIMARKEGDIERA